jgi:hypothetical protein
MRLISILIVLVFCFSIIATGASFDPGGEPVAPTVKALDVCHSSPLAANSDLPYISACPSTPLPLRAATILKPCRISIHPLLIAFQDERPPKAFS